MDEYLFLSYKWLLFLYKRSTFYSEQRFKQKKDGAVGYDGTLFKMTIFIQLTFKVIS